MKAIIALTVVIGTLVIAISIYFSSRWIGRRAGNFPYLKRFCRLYSAAVKEISVSPSERGNEYQNHDINMIGDSLNRVRLEELSLLDLEKLAAATNNFHWNNKLGQGGFGPVYRVICLFISSFYMALF